MDGYDSWIPLIGMCFVLLLLCLPFIALFLEPLILKLAIGLLLALIVAPLSVEVYNATH